MGCGRLVVVIVLCALAPGQAARAGFDLVPEVFDVGVEVADVPQADVDEGCAGGTTGRKLLRYALRARNVGTDDLVLGDPGCPDCTLYPGAPCTNPLFTCSLSHGHPHFESFAQADLLDGTGTVVAGNRKVSFCLIDNECAAPQFTSCNGVQGISAGCADVYEAALPCQYIDLTDAAIGPGPYTLRATLDPDGVLAESDETNNVVTRTVRVECPALPGQWSACALDPFLCYRARPAEGATEFAPVPAVTVADPTETLTVALRARPGFCTPADANGGGIVDPATHLASYVMKPATPSLQRAHLRIVNALGALVVDAQRPELLLVPTARSLVAPPAPPDPGLVDHYACRRAKTSRGTPRFPKGLQMVVGDEFTAPAKRFDVRKLRRLCTPVDVNGAGIRNPRASLACYSARPASGEPRFPGVAAIFFRNDVESSALDTRREAELCLPTLVNPPHDDCADPLPVSTFPETLTQDTSAATTAADDPVLSCGTQDQKSHSVWLVLTAPATGTVTADTAGSDYDTALAAFTGACGALTELACNDDYGAVTSRITFPVVAGGVYRLEVTSYDTTPAGTAVVNVSFAP